MTRDERLMQRVCDRIEAEAKRMAAECAAPPCLHAQGLDLATIHVRDVFAEVRYEERLARQTKRRAS